MTKRQPSHYLKHIFLLQRPLRLTNPALGMRCGAAADATRQFFVIEHDAMVLSILYLSETKWYKTTPLRDDLPASTAQWDSKTSAGLPQD